MTADPTTAEDAVTEGGGTFATGGPVHSPVNADTPPSWLTGCMFSDVARVFVLPDRSEGDAR